jgi:hypothetical protein
MSGPSPALKSVTITTLAPGTPFDFQGTKGVVIEHLKDERVKVMLREKPQCRGGWKWREALWPTIMRVNPEG